MKTSKEENYELQNIIAQGVRTIMTDAMKATLKNPKESAFLVKFMASASRATALRKKLEKEDFHVPGFLIASVTSSCNLHCAGCYSRCIHTTTDDTPSGQLTGEEWAAVFVEAKSLGISFIFIAGGEPLLRRDILTAAGKIREILFLIFTNGTYIDEEYLNLFDSCRNLVPVFSIEGEKKTTDERRGDGMYDRIISNMETFRKKQLVFGASVTVTTENLQEVMSVPFISGLVEKGCKMVLFIEFVPVTQEAAHLAPGDREREQMEQYMQELRVHFPNLVLLSFPGDELAMGGCMAAGRGFFHINSMGGAEPCPFSPYSDVNVKEMSLKEALKSPLFTALRASDFLKEQHAGGCVLYEKRKEVESMLAK